MVASHEALPQVVERPARNKPAHFKIQVHEAHVVPGTMGSTKKNMFWRASWEDARRAGHAAKGDGGTGTLSKFLFSFNSLVWQQPDSDPMRQDDGIDAAHL